MAGIQNISWKKFNLFLKKSGCVHKRTTADHLVYWKKGLKRPIIVPLQDPLAPFIVKNALKQLGIETEEFLAKTGQKKTKKRK
jgi:hypothetical protein